MSLVYALCCHFAAAVRCLVLASSVSFTSAGAAKAHSLRCSSFVGTSSEPLASGFAESSLSPLRLLSPRDPLRWARAGAPFGKRRFASEIERGRGPKSHRVRVSARIIYKRFWRSFASSSQAPYRSFRRRRQNSFSPLRLLSPLGPFHWARRGPRLANAGLSRISNAIPTKWIAFEKLSPCIRSRRPASSPG